MAKLLKDWFAVPDGKLYPEMFEAGTELTGELLDRASALGLVDDKSADPKVKAQAKAKAEAAAKAAAEGQA